MGTPQPTMAATQILVALCVVGSAVAAAAAEAVRIEAQRRTAQAEAARRQQIAAANAAAAAAAAEKNAFDSQVSADLGPMVNPVYNFEYKVDLYQDLVRLSRERGGNLSSNMISLPWGL